MVPTPIPADLTSAWQLALEFWTQPLRHDTLLGIAAKHGQYAWLAARYRDAARTNPEDPIARERLARVGRATVAALAFTAPKPSGPPERKPYRAVSTMLVAAVLATGVGLWITDYKVRNTPKPPIVSTHP